MTIHTRIRTFGAAALLALAVVGMSAGQADAEPKKPGGQPKLCSLPGHTVGSSNDYEFYAPGDVVTINGEKWTCTSDGQFTKYRIGTLGGVQPVTPGTIFNAP